MHAGNVSDYIWWQSIFLLQPKKCWAKGDLIRFGKKLLLLLGGRGRALRSDVWVRIWGNIFFIALYRGLGPVSLFPPPSSVTPECRAGLAYSSVFLSSFFISKSLLTKKMFGETAVSVIHRDCFVGWEKASFLVSSDLPGPWSSDTWAECVKDRWQSSRYPPVPRTVCLSDQKIPARCEEFAVIELLGLL